jgi:hypothetical protein
MVTEERVVNLEATLAEFIAQTNRVIAAIHEDVAEIRVSNARTDRRLRIFRPWPAFIWMPRSLPF